MHITAISDLHGDLISINKTDLLVIAGDWSPLEIQTSYSSMLLWLEHVFIPWLGSIKAGRIAIIAGNHDFVCDNTYILFKYGIKKDFYKDVFYEMLRKVNLHKKVKYLHNSLMVYKGVRIFGFPYVYGCEGWAFSSAQVRGLYKEIPECDILITHQPPKYGTIATTKLYDKIVELGDKGLYDRILQVKPKIVFSGHIHEGDHSQHTLDHVSGDRTLLYNCSVKNEDYEVFFKPQEVDYAKSKD